MGELQGDLEQLWLSICALSREQIQRDVVLEPFLSRCILRFDCFSEALVSLLADFLSSPDFERNIWCELLSEDAIQQKINQAAFNDLNATVQRDPASWHALIPFLYHKGFLALQLYRISSHLWQLQRRLLASYVHGRVARDLAVDIHPAAKIGSGIMLDHATGVVVGETAVIADNVSILHSVTLGGTGKEHADRHPKVGSGVLIGAGAKILGNISIGRNAKIAAGSVVLVDVADFATVAGVPARVIATYAGMDAPALGMC